MKNLIAKTQTGITIECKVEIDENGELKTQYPVVRARNAKMKINGYSLELTGEQVEEISGKKCPVKKVNVMLLDQSAWPKMKEKAERIKNEKSWAKMLENNEKLELRQGFTSCGSSILGLPEALKDKEKILLKHLTFEWDMKDERFILTITAKELLSAVEKAEGMKNDENEKTATRTSSEIAESNEAARARLWDAENDGDLDNIYGDVAGLTYRDF